MSNVSHIIIGNVYISNNFGKYIVLEKTGKDKNRRFLFRIKFLETGYETIVSSNIIYKGQVKDYLFRNVMGIGYLEKPRNIFENKKIYNKLWWVWLNMLYRCYNKSSPSYLLYGKKGIFVKKDWYSFWNFYHDAQKLSGWDEELFLSSKIQLDKDYKIFDNKVYSFATCIWLNTHVNKSYTKTVNRKLIKGVSPSGIEFVFQNIKEFSRDYNLTDSNISTCLKNPLLTHKGWRFEYIYDNR